ncbi:hypothetical protein Moror_12214 [Moniliophthora roreri MCA 2997]|uniref:CxC2-like cysteine cluster KDZ transposase-associated domain-containing protein n=1 Tax=Moniliophthora roreri (strain MCA 2997) TaxID=1381753 RepID=V2W6C3_MONRO|nr:hypothetical protein Moror_12214 [Moniliophthora roreri MCA 2997]
MQLICKSCILDSHQNCLLHVIWKWNGQYYEWVSLASLGLVVQLGHHSNMPCPAPNTHIPSNFTVLHTNGFHQLLSYEWYPATTKIPQTCFTFRLLEHFHTMTLVGKINAYNYYCGLQNLTDNSGNLIFKDRYESFRRVTREWRHLKMLKRAGRGNNGMRSVNQTHPSELAIVCPACPHPGINLPDGWE